MNKIDSTSVSLKHFNTESNLTYLINKILSFNDKFNKKFNFYFSL